MRDCHECHPVIGHAPDGATSPPTVTSDASGKWSAAVPIKWLLQKNDDVHNFVTTELLGGHMAGGQACVLVVSN